MTMTMTQESPAPRPAPGPLSPVRRVTLVIGLLVSLVTIGSGVLWVVEQGSRTTERLDFTLTPTDELFTVDTDTGDITVTPSPDDRVHVTRITEFGGDPPIYAETPNGSGDRLSGRCASSWPWGECSVTYRVAVPTGLSLQLRTHTGDVVAGGVGGALDLRSDTGNVEVRNVDGPLMLRSSTGDVIAAAVRSARVDAESSTGDVTLRFADAPQNVTAVTNTGDVRMWLPDGPYEVDVDTDAGDTTIGVPTSSTADRDVLARTDTGDVELLGAR